MKIRIDQEPSFNFEFLPKVFGEISITVSHDDDIDTLIPPRSHRVAQLRELFSTEESTEMTKKDENDAPALPQLAEANGAISRRVDQCDRCQSGRGTHVNLLSGLAPTLL